MAVVAGLTLVSGQVCAQSPNDPGSGTPLVLTLPAAVALALRDNLTLRSTYLDRIVQRLSLEVAEEAFTPKLDIGGRAGFQRSQEGEDQVVVGTTPTVTVGLPTGGDLSFVWSADAADGDNSGRRFSSGTGITLTQPLLRGAGTGIGRAPVRRARIGERINILGLKDTVAATVTTVISGYRTYQQAIRQVEIARRGLEEARKQFEINRQLIESGRMASLENVQTEQRIATQELSVIAAEGDAAEARIALATLLNLDVDTPIEPAEPIEPRQVTVSLENAYETAFDNRADWQSNLLQIELSDIDLMIARNDRLPQVDVELGAGRRSGVEDNLGSAVRGAVDGRPEWSASVVFAVPTIGTKSLVLNETAARVARQKAELNNQLLTSQIRSDVRNAVRDVEMSWRRLQLAIRARELAAQQLAIEKEKLQAGRTSNFQLLTFEQTMIDAANAEVSANIAYENALTTLDQTLGTTLETWQIELRP
ncbi:TolC family protein [Thalassobaculum sp. OXR-137]|uniref:TolC family protein n=1 Tax=Thalassobaculum sp. OXR-137 TaxID=3100173 RepID=UPI002AC96E11|nr:TolC family protein [Thalassobaculum sp. OXR-137]WPZ34008.1 TolC family protein [Thalassobaculum sp. OXR-137]